MTYDIILEPEVHAIRLTLPGHIRQRIRRLIDDLSTDPRSHTSRALDITAIDLPPGVEIRRVRLERWRIVYAVNDADGWVWVLGIRQRPPYNYSDLPELARKIQP
ncbi:MAG: type II toxin-antitoxin system RelE family toxin [Roseiflexaceae bacterium]